MTKGTKNFILILWAILLILAALALAELWILRVEHRYPIVTDAAAFVLFSGSWLAFLAPPLLSFPVLLTRRLGSIWRRLAYVSAIFAIIWAAAYWVLFLYFPSMEGPSLVLKMRSVMANAQPIIAGLQTYKAKSGAYPNNIQSLVPTYIRNMPKPYGDRFSKDPDNVYKYESLSSVAVCKWFINSHLQSVTPGISKGGLYLLKAYVRDSEILVWRIQPYQREAVSSSRQFGRKDPVLQEISSALSKRLYAADRLWHLRELFGPERSMEVAVEGEYGIFENGYEMWHYLYVPKLAENNAEEIFNRSGFRIGDWYFYGSGESEEEYLNKHKRKFGAARESGAALLFEALLGR